MEPKIVANLTEQVRLCEQATLAIKSYHEAKGMVPAEELEQLRLAAEFHFEAIKYYLSRYQAGKQGDEHGR